MTSILKVDRIEARQSGGKVTFGSPIDPDGFSSNYRAGEIIEELKGVCDGQTITVTSGTYTLPNVTVVQELTNGRTDVTGSAITYTPPPGTKKVIYSLEMQWDSTENSGISNFIVHHSTDNFVSDDNIIKHSGRQVAVNYISGISHHAGFPVTIQAIFKCDADAENLEEGEFTSWTTPKQIKITGAEHGGSYECRLHFNTYFNNTPTGYTTAELQFVRPILTIKAIA